MHWKLQKLYTKAHTFCCNSCSSHHHETREIELNCREWSFVLEQAFQFYTSAGTEFLAGNQKYIVKRVQPKEVQALG